MLSSLADVDRSLLGYVIPYRSGWLDTICPALSDLGARGFVWLVVAGILLVFPRRRAGAWRVVLVMGFTFLIVDAGLKELMWRARPFEVVPDVRVLVGRPVTSSFPSGHAASAFAGALATARVLPEARWLWWTLAAAIAYSRLYVGVHFPFDVLAGALLGSAGAWFVLGGRHPSTSHTTLGQMARDGATIRP